ncbi:MAG: FtsW/RodA/SpoVE family cell cycle protein, partial [Hyphomicrobiaceae bacterium]
AVGVLLLGGMLLAWLAIPRGTAQRLRLFLKVGVFPKVGVCIVSLVGAGFVAFSELWPERAETYGLRIGLGGSATVVFWLWIAATLAVWIAFRDTLLGPLLWALITVLAAIGNVTIAQLGYGSSGDRFVEYFQRSLPALALLAAATVLVLAVEKQALRDMLSRVAFPQLGTAWSDRVRKAPIRLTAFALALWFLFGTDEGINRVLQPSEYVKFGALYAIGLLVVTCYTNWVVLPGEASFKRAFRLTITLFLLFVALIAVPIFQHDLSPLLIVGLTGIFLGCVGGTAAIVNAVCVRWTQLFPTALPPAMFGFRSPPRWPYRKGLGAIIVSASKTVVSLRHMLELVVAIAVGAPRFVTRYFFFILFAMAVGASGIAYGWYTSWKDFSGRQIEAADEARGGGWTKFYGRLMSYLDLRFDRYPPTGSVQIDYADEGRQVRLSRKAIALAPCRPPVIDEFGISGIGVLDRAAGALVGGIVDYLAHRACAEPKTEAAKLGAENAVHLHDIPILQSDFIGAYLIGRFGIVTAAAVAMVQALIVAIAFGVGMVTYQGTTGQEKDRARRHLLSILCIGGGGLLGLQWFIAWSNVFGLMPVMGQPMSLIAYASSNTVLLVVPIVAVLLTTIRLDRDEWAQPLGVRPRRIGDWI